MTRCTLKLAAARGRRLGRRLHTVPDQMIEGDRPWTAGDDEKQARCPQNVVRPAVGIDEELDDRRHAEKAKRR